MKTKKAKLITVKSPERKRTNWKLPCTLCGKDWIEITQGYGINFPYIFQKGGWVCAVCYAKANWNNPFSVPDVYEPEEGDIIGVDDYSCVLPVSAGKEGVLG